MRRCVTALLLVLLVASWAHSDGQGDEAAKWEARYEQLLKERPDIRRKVESGDASKADVIAWMKEGGEGEKARGKDRYYGWQVEVRDPREFNRTQEKTVFSGPQPGEQLPDFEAITLNGPKPGQRVNPVKEALGKPLVLVFQDHTGVARKGLFLLGPVLKVIKRQSKADVAASVVFLGDDPAGLDPREVDELGKRNGLYSFAYSEAGRDGPGSYGLDRNVAMTIIVADADGKVQHNFAFVQPMLYPDPHVVGALAEAVNQDLETVTKWLKYDAGDEEHRKDKSTMKSRSSTSSIDRRREQNVR